MVVRISSSCSCVTTFFSSPFKSSKNYQLSSRGTFSSHQYDWQHFKGKSWKFRQRMLKLRGNSTNRSYILSSISEDQSYIELEADGSEQETNIAKDGPDVRYMQFEGSNGKAGFISFYNHPYKKADETILSVSQNNKNNLLWFIGPTVLIASFIFPSLYLRRILSTIFEDSLLTDFLILFFTEAIFYCGVAVFVVLIDHLRKPFVGMVSAVTTDRNMFPHFGHKISSVATLVLSLIIPMVTMGLVWPWTGPAASATLAPFLVGIVVQFAFEQYVRYRQSPSWPVIPIIFQVYRLHQLNRAAQLVTALSFTVRGAEMTPHNLAINSSLSTLLNVLQFLGVICIWSLSSFLMRFYASVAMPEK